MTKNTRQEAGGRGAVAGGSGWGAELHLLGLVEVLSVWPGVAGVVGAGGWSWLSGHNSVNFILGQTQCFKSLFH